MQSFSRVVLLLCALFTAGLAHDAQAVEITHGTDLGSRIIVSFQLNVYDIGDVSINNMTCSRISIPGQVTFLEEGFPELPTIARNIIIPDDALMDYRILDVEYETQKVSPIVPSKGNLSRNIDPDDIPYTFSAVYETDAWWPTHTIEIYEPFILRDYRGMSVRFNPFQYNPTTDELRIARRVVVELYAKAQGGANVITSKKQSVTREFASIYDEIFLNFGETRYDSLSERAGRMVIITADAYINNLDDFKEWKRMKGIETKVVPISSIGNNTTAIANFIQNEYDAGDLVWVLLVGDGNEVIPGVGTIGTAYGKDADPVYAYTAGSDYYPDIFISRFSSRSGNAQNIDKQVSRSIEYEKSPQSADWYYVGLGVASALTGGTGYADSTRMNWLRDSLLAYTYTTVNKSYDYWGTTALIKGYIEAGTSIINYMGHGSVSGWGNGGGFHTSDINNLNNPWMLPFVISVACVVGNFDGYDCYCEASVTAGTVNQPDGFLVHWGSTIDQSWVPPCIGQEGAVNLLTHDKKNTFGGMCFNGACYMIEYYSGGSAGVEMAQTWHIFGDASIQVRTDMPQSMSVSHDPSINVNQTTFDVSVPGVQSALVGLYIDTLLVGHGYTNASGNVTITLDPAPSEAGTMYVTVTAYNRIPYLGSALIVEGDIVPPSTPFVVDVAKRKSSIDITWLAVTDDTLDNPETMDCYIVYRNATPDFVPSNSDSIGVCIHPDTTFTDDNALGDGQNYYYLVKAVDQTGNRSAKSNMSYVFSKFFNENPDATDKNWVSLPYDNSYLTVSDLTDDVSPTGDPLIKITYMREDQNYDSWIWDPDFQQWQGTNFIIWPDRAYEMVTITDTVLTFVGCNDPDGLVFLNENTSPPRTDKNWVPIPYNAVYETVSDITDEYSPAGNPLIKLTNMRDDQLYESYVWDNDFTQWAGNDFTIEAGRGYEFVTVVDTSWNPTEYSNRVTRDRRNKASPRARRDGSHAEILVGTATEPDRAPQWIMYGEQYVVASASEHNINDRTAGLSHIVRMQFVLPQIENCSFAAYRPEMPYDVLTDNMVGSCIMRDDERVVLWFDVGIFKIPWRVGELIVVLIEASTQTQDYYAVTAAVLEEDVSVQNIGRLVVKPMPQPDYTNGAARWQTSTNEAIIGYSVYHEEQRLNTALVTKGYFVTETDIEIRPVIAGGYEVKASGAQSELIDDAPLLPAMTISPVPFRKHVTVSYQISQSGWVGISIYDAAGRLVQTLASGRYSAGYHSATWDGADAAGRPVPAGVYFVTFKTDTYQAVEKTILLR